ncbi:9545_t:CDS:2 [Ambispora leptoticha]|uniref:9545_t:CDS:1 n=1 Tax=Ambispora leptoticha TaxID=144679 RepID=A0A9N8WLN7_9GLOM|nr:9545_t:CDS:2 [Ambispora leptoticha]
MAKNIYFIIENKSLKSQLSLLEERLKCIERAQSSTPNQRKGKKIRKKKDLFHMEKTVIQIKKVLKKKWCEQKAFVELFILLALKRHINKSLEYLDEEVVHVLQTNYKSIYSMAKIKVDSELDKVNKKREYHSDELIGTDIKLVAKEKNSRPNNHVIKVYVLPWRSERAKEVALTNQANKIIRERHYDKNWIQNTRPPLDAPFWTIASSYNYNRYGDYLTPNTSNNDPEPGPTDDTRSNNNPELEHINDTRSNNDLESDADNYNFRRRPRNELGFNNFDTNEPEINNEGSTNSGCNSGHNSEYNSGRRPRNDDSDTNDPNHESTSMNNNPSTKTPVRKSSRIKNRKRMNVPTRIFAYSEEETEVTDMHQILVSYRTVPIRPIL